MASAQDEVVSDGRLLEHRSEVLDFLETCRQQSREELTIDDLRRAIGCNRSSLVFKDFTEISEAEGRTSFTLDECYCVLKTNDFLKDKPWLSKILRLSTYMVVSKRKRPATIVRCVSSYTSCSSRASSEKRSFLHKPLLQLPTFILIISAIQLTTFAYYCVVPSCPTVKYVCQVPCNSSLIFDPRRRHEVWRYFTYSLVHDGFLHLLSNVALQVAFGLPLEIIHGWWRIAIVYSCGILCGPLGQSFINPNAFIAGSSSGVYALQTAHLANIIINFKDMECVWLRLASLLCIYGQDIYRSIYGVQEWHGRNVGYVGHYGGAMAGLFVGVPALKTFQYASWTKCVEYVMFIVFCLLLTSAVLWNVLDRKSFATGSSITQR